MSGQPSASQTIPRACPTLGRPAGCNANLDADCEPQCGNGAVETGETCDGNCPSDCNDSNSCTEDLLVGSSQDCDAACEYQSISDCQAGDGRTGPGERGQAGVELREKLLGGTS